MEWRGASAWPGTDEKCGAAQARALEHRPLAANSLVRVVVPEVKSDLDTRHQFEEFNKERMKAGKKNNSFLTPVPAFMPSSSRMSRGCWPMMQQIPPPRGIPERQDYARFSSWGSSMRNAGTQEKEKLNLESVPAFLPSSSRMSGGAARGRNKLGRHAESLNVRITPGGRGRNRFGDCGRNSRGPSPRPSPGGRGRNQFGDCGRDSRGPSPRPSPGGRGRNRHVTSTSCV